MAVPKATVHKNRTLPSWKDDIGGAGQIFSVKPEPVAEAMQH
jgi:hypothetical protein